MVALVLATIVGATAVVMAQLFDQTVRGVRDVREILDVTPLSAVPVIRASRAGRARRRLNAALVARLGGAAGGLAAAIVMAYYLVARGGFWG
jgi:hypothetical protein